MAHWSNAIDIGAVKSLPAMFFAQAARHGDKPFLWRKSHDPYHALSWRKIADSVAAAARGL